jgi:hypothetical protein
MSGVSQAILFAALGKTRPRIRFLCVAGGGPAGVAGGGAGGMLEQAGNNLGTGTYAVTVGVNGGDSSIAGIITTKGGGRGAEAAGWSPAGQSGGSGGGGSQRLNVVGDGTVTNPAAPGIAGQGNGGGLSWTDDQNMAYAHGGGGGGAGGAGGGQLGAGGPGGVGRQSDITGSNVYYAGGGGGGGLSLGGTPGPNGSPGAGVYGRGGQGYGGSGLAGVVIFRYAYPVQAGSGGTVTQLGGEWIHTFTASGNFIWNPPPA